MLVAIARSCGNSLSDVRLLAMAALAFAAFLQCYELINLHCCDISFSSESMSVNFPKSKTDHYREGSSVLVARSSTATCPVGIMKCYFEKAALDHTTTKFVFRGVMLTKMEKSSDNQATSVTVGCGS